MTQSREIRLVKRPVALPDSSCFELATVDLPEPGDWQVLVKYLWMSVDPYMRGRMDEGDSYIPAFALGHAMEGGAVDQVVQSNSDELLVGDYVESMQREFFVADAAKGGLSKRDPDLVPLQTYLGIAGMPGMTAYCGLTLVAEAKAGETVFVSGAASAVGSTVCQIAKIYGCTAIGSAGSDEKVDWLKNTAGIDIAFDYKSVSSVADALTEAAPEGIDVYFENVGGQHLNAALTHMKRGGPVALCGLIADYNTRSTQDEPGLFSQILSRSTNVQGFIVTEFYDRYPDFLNLMSGWIAEGAVPGEETIVDGIDNAPDAFLGLFSGSNTGKMLVRLA